MNRQWIEGWTTAIHAINSLRVQCHADGNQYGWDRLYRISKYLQAQQAAEAAAYFADEDTDW